MDMTLGVPDFSIIVRIDTKFIFGWFGQFRCRGTVCESETLGTFMRYRSWVMLDLSIMHLLRSCDLPDFPIPVKNNTKPIV